MKKALRVILPVSALVSCFLHFAAVDRDAFLAWESYLNEGFIIGGYSPAAPFIVMLSSVLPVVCAALAAVLLITAVISVISGKRTFIRASLVIAGIACAVSVLSNLVSSVGLGGYTYDPPATVFQFLSCVFFGASAILSDNALSSENES